MLLKKWSTLFALLLASWVVMTFTHELGHVIGGWLSGGHLVSCDLLPWHVPYSLFDPDPHPLVTLWAGPWMGCLIPVSIALTFKHRYLTFIAAFCVLANGSYLGTAWWTNEALLDTPRLFAHGASKFSVLAFVIVSTIAGYLSFRRACISILSPSQKSAEIGQAASKID